MEKERKIFRSRISVFLIVFIFLIFLPASIPIFIYKIYLGAYILGGAFVFTVLIFTGMRYIISEGKLYLKIWFIPTCSLNIANIASVERSYFLFDIPTNTTASFKKLY